MKRTVDFLKEKAKNEKFKFVILQMKTILQFIKGKRINKLPLRSCQLDVYVNNNLFSTFNLSKRGSK